MSSWRPAGSRGSPPPRHDDHPGALPPAPPHGAAGSQASQLFPVPKVTAAIASNLASQPSQPDTTRPRQPAAIEDTETWNPPHQYGAAAKHPWAPYHHQGVATLTGTAPWVPSFAPSHPTFPSWAVPMRPTVMVPAETLDFCSGGTEWARDANAPAAGCLRVATSVGSRAAGEGCNFIVSPLSLHAALALVAAGAKGETQRELLGFLVGSASTLETLHGTAAAKLVGMLRRLPQTSFACGVWVDRRWALRPEFEEVAGAVYAAVAESVDFVSQAQQARQQVNDFVEHATDGLIHDVLPPDSVDASTVVVLANALYFKAAWSQPFDRS